MTIEIRENESLENALRRFKRELHQHGVLESARRQVGARIGARGNEIRVRGTREQVARATELLNELMKLIRMGHPITAGEVEYAARVVAEGNAEAADVVFTDVVLVSDRGKPVKPHTQTQREYVDAIARADLTFAIGPAGTGKTYLAMAMAVKALQERRASRLILTRPALEAGERLGFLPGDVQAKVDPYLRPLFDALYDMMDLEKVQDLIGRGTVEVAPLAFMRGRTLNDSFIILDEAQNTTPEPWSGTSWCSASSRRTSGWGLRLLRRPAVGRLLGPRGMAEDETRRELWQRSLERSRRGGASGRATGLPDLAASRSGSDGLGRPVLDSPWVQSVPGQTFTSAWRAESSADSCSEDGGVRGRRGYRAPATDRRGSRFPPVCAPATRAG